MEDAVKTIAFACLSIACFYANKSLKRKNKRDDIIDGIDILRYVLFVIAFIYLGLGISSSFMVL